ncbi:Uncharacterised protein [uncultured archaeon]|nr:Uncharacterised protein [uncultured archaeon]
MATSQALYEQNSSQGGSTVATAWPQLPTQGVGAQNLDLLQIISQSGSVLVNVDSAGAVHKPAVSATNGTRVGVFLSRLTSASSTAAIFADAFSNPSQFDILQVRNAGGNIHYNLTYQGVAVGS